MSTKDSKSSATIAVAVACSVVVAFAVLTTIVFLLNKNTKQQLTRLYVQGVRAGASKRSIIRDPAITNPASW
jgi:hypothetical protein